MARYCSKCYGERCSCEKWTTANVWDSKKPIKQLEFVEEKSFPSNNQIESNEGKLPWYVRLLNWIMS